MTPEQIKSEVDRMYAQIKSASERLAELRKICKHEKEEVEEYSWRIGTSSPACVCSYCGHLLEWYVGENRSTIDASEQFTDHEDKRHDEWMRQQELNRDNPEL